MEQSASGGRHGAKSYLTGFMLALVLTAVPFAVVAALSWTLAREVAPPAFDAALSSSRAERGDRGAA